ncbi:MAG: HAD-IIA family hydrolase [Pseudonocardiaceae bacterium]|nr:HAD-IIA family hydrolase [Pseudonocardiaceae bacterium]
MTAVHAGYDGLLLDLDGTVYRGEVAIPAAPGTVGALRGSGVGMAFVTNNASRSPGQVAEHLVSVGVEVAADEVVTSGQAAAALLADRLAPGSAILVVGTDALAAEVEAVGLRPVRKADADPSGVIQGHSPETAWPLLAEACLAIRAGAVWVACNIDTTLPTERGELPGNGALVAALRAATGREPLVAGKPARALVDAAVERLGARHPLLVGDRLETDIAAAHGVMESLLVLSGVTDAPALLAAPAGQRPTFVGADVAALGEEPEALRIGERPGWRATVTGDELTLHSDGAGHHEALDALRALCHQWWAGPGGVVTVTATDAAAAAALRALGLAGSPVSPSRAQERAVG